MTPTEPVQGPTVNIQIIPTQEELDKQAYRAAWRAEFVEDMVTGGGVVLAIGLVVGYCYLWYYSILIAASITGVAVAIGAFLNWMDQLDRRAQTAVLKANSRKGK